MRKGQNQVESVLSRRVAIALAHQHPHLSHAQKSVIEDVRSSQDRIQGIQGFAGAGKTTTLTLIRSAAETQGYQVEGFAPTSRVLLTSPDDRRLVDLLSCSCRKLRRHCGLQRGFGPQRTRSPSFDDRMREHGLSSQLSGLTSVKTPDGQAVSGLSFLFAN
jgi:hypothetical protein